MLENASDDEAAGSYEEFASNSRGAAAATPADVLVVEDALQAVADRLSFAQFD